MIRNIKSFLVFFTLMIFYGFSSVAANYTQKDIDNFNKIFDEVLFRAGSKADIKKAKKFADIARKKGLEKTIINFDVIDICYEAGEINNLPQGKEDIFPETVCQDVKNNSNNYKDCIFKNGSNLDIASLYANGIGVKQDFMKAIAYVCHGAKVPAELAGMVQDLYEAKKSGVLKTKFSYCNGYATSSVNTAECSNLKNNLALQGIKKSLDSITSDFADNQKALYQDLEKKAFEFFDIRANSEQNLSHSMAGSDISDMKLEQKKWLKQSIEEFELGKLKMPISKDFLQVDKTLNQEYKEVLQLIDSVSISCEKRGYLGFTIRKENVKKSQRAWLKYRDALAKFGASRYQKTSMQDWQNWLSGIRIKELQDMKSDIKIYEE